MWDLKQATEPETLDLFVYGDVEGDGYDWWTGNVVESETSAQHFREALAEHPNAKQINVYINSYGGSVFEGTAIYTQLKRHPANVTAYIDGFACSIASVIAMAADKVVMPKNAMMMIHNAWMWVAGNSSELRKAAEDLEKINKGNRQAYLIKAGDKLTEDKLVELLDGETWLTAEECLAYGLADEYGEKDVDVENATNAMQKINLSLAQQLKINKSIAAQLRELKAEAIPDKPVEQPEPAENPTEDLEVVETVSEPEKPAENKVLNLFKAIGRKEN